MLVKLEPGAGPAVIEAIRSRAAASGASVDLFDGQPDLVVVSGGRVEALATHLAAIGGVEQVLQARSDDAPVTSNLRIVGIRPLYAPAIVTAELPISASAARLVQSTRAEVVDIMNGVDDRLLVVVGPCSIHDPVAALEYAGRLADLERRLNGDLRIVMRVYYEKPRTTVGWKGLINDPHADGSFAVNEGLRIARRLLVDVLDLGLPVGCEFLDPITPQFISDAVTWAAIGARTTESQIHRNLTSGLSMPVGFKNGTSGDVQIALDAMQAAAYPHHFMSILESGIVAIVETTGNPDTHLILRGGRTGPNYDPTSVQSALDSIEAAGLPPRLMVDASHGNSNKDYRKQVDAAAAVAEQVAAGQHGIFGVMLESFLVDGRQEIGERSRMTYGQSVTDACMGWEMTVPVLEGLAEAVRKRRNA